MGAWKGLFAAVLAVAPPAGAHVSPSPSEAAAGAYQVVRFGVGHGCDGAATTSLRIEVPETVPSARPQPKAGWSLQIEPRRDAAHGVAAVTWTGLLPADEFEEFVIQFKLPDAPGVLYFPTVQTCGERQAQWIGEPDADPGAPPLAHPAPALRLVPAGAPETSHHH